MYVDCTVYSVQCKAQYIRAVTSMYIVPAHIS